MEEKECIQRGNKLHLKFEISNKMNSSDNYITDISPDYVINGLIIFQVKINVSRFREHHNSSSYYGSVFIRFVKTLQSDKLTYALKLSSEQFGIQYNMFLSDDTSWRQVHEFSKPQCTNALFVVPFALTVALDLPSSAGPLASLHDDTDLTDFELRGEDGSVHMHKAILAGYSPMLRSLVSGDWRESEEGSVHVPGTTKKTLQNLKDYMYLHTLPENGLQHLMLLASYYLMEDLEQKCSVKLLNELSAKNAFELAEFAAKHKMKKLFLAIMENVQRGIIKVEDMEKGLPSVDKLTNNNKE